MERVRVVVVGGGVMGSATAWSLARRGVEVVLLERFGPGHHEGASHGATRNFNTAYGSAHYLDLVLRARTLWHELEADSGAQVLDPVGLVNHGGGPGRWDAVQAALTARGEQADWVAADQAHERWPALRFAPTPDGRDVLWVPGGARMRSAVALAALHDGVARHGGEVRYDVRVLAVLPRLGGGARVVTDDGELAADVVVVTAGAWTRELVGALVPLPELVVTQEQPVHAAVVDAGLLAGGDLPGFNHAIDPADDEQRWFRSDVYGMLTPGEGIKAGWHGTGPVVDPDARSYLPEADQLADLQRYLAEWVPGADAARVEPISCTYTSTANTDFVLDRLGDVVVGAGFSGHGFKFATAIGEVLGDLAVGAGRASGRAAEPFRFTGRDGVAARAGFGS